MSSRDEEILKDTHICNNDSSRFDRWTEIAQEESQRPAEKS